MKVVSVYTAARNSVEVLVVGGGGGAPPAIGPGSGGAAAHLRSLSP